MDNKIADALSFADLISSNLRASSSHQQPSPPTHSSISTTTPNQQLIRRQTLRVEDLDRRSLSLYSEIEDLKRRLLLLSNQCNPQRLETELRRAATNILGPIIGNIHDQTRIELNNIRNLTNVASTRAEAAYCLANQARHEVNIYQTKQSIPNVQTVFNESNNVLAPKWEAEHKQEIVSERMWERIDNHLACHELRLRKSTDQFIRSAMKRSIIEIELDRRQNTKQSSSNSESGGGSSSRSDGDGNSNVNDASMLSTSSTFNSLHSSSSSAATAPDTESNTTLTNVTSDYIRLKRTIDDEIINMTQYKQNLTNKTKADMDAWKIQLTKELTEHMNKSLQEMTLTFARNEQKENTVTTTNNTNNDTTNKTDSPLTNVELLRQYYKQVNNTEMHDSAEITLAKFMEHENGLSSLEIRLKEKYKISITFNRNENGNGNQKQNQNQNDHEEAKIRAQLGPILRSHQEEIDKLRNDLILHKLQSSTRTSTLEEDIHILQEAMRKMQIKLRNVTTTTNASKYTSGTAPIATLPKQRGTHNKTPPTIPPLPHTVPQDIASTTTTTSTSTPSTPSKISTSSTPLNSSTANSLFSPAIPLRSTEIANGRSLHDWGASDVDRWLLKWGANDAIRRRFAEIEIDGEMLSLLERSDIEGDMGMLELTSKTTIERLLNEIETLKMKHGILSVDIDGESEGPFSPGESDVDSNRSTSPKSPLADQIAEISSKEKELNNIRKQLELYGYPANP